MAAAQQRIEIDLLSSDEDEAPPRVAVDACSDDDALSPPQQPPVIDATARSAATADNKFTTELNVLLEMELAPEEVCRAALLHLDPAIEEGMRISEAVNIVIATVNDGVAITQAERTAAKASMEPAWPCACFASSAAIAAASVHPAPWVFGVSTRA